MPRRVVPQQAARLVRDCQHVQARHEHGTRAAYVFDGCRCKSCGEANTAEERRRSTAIVYGTWSGLVDAAPARQHVQALREAGLSLERTAALSGVGQGTINSLIYGVPARDQPPPARIRVDTERRLLEVQFDPSEVAAGRRVDATGTRRRLQALATLGWSVPPLAVHSGLTARTLRRALTNGAVTAQTARAVAALYDQLQTTSAPRRTPQERAAAKKAIARARGADWLPPGGWDDIDNEVTDEEDDSAAPPAEASDLDEVAIERAMEGQRVPLTAQERCEAVARLTRRGLSARRIAELLHTTSRTVTRVRCEIRTAA